MNKSSMLVYCFQFFIFFRHEEERGGKKRGRENRSR